MSQEKKQNLAMLVAIAVVVAGAAFYSGMLYGKSSVSGQSNKGNFAGRAGMMGGAGGANRSAGMRGGATIGEVLKIDDKSLTLKLADGGSKICYLNSSSTISKFSAGSAADLTVGTNVVVNGATNSDGTITATMVQIRPANMPGFGGGQRNGNDAKGDGQPNDNRPANNQPTR